MWPMRCAIRSIAASHLAFFKLLIGLSLGLLTSATLTRDGIKSVRTDTGMHCALVLAHPNQSKKRMAIGRVLALQNNAGNNLSSSALDAVASTHQMP